MTTFKNRAARDDSIVKALAGTASLRQIGEDHGVTAPTVIAVGERLAPHLLASRSEAYGPKKPRQRGGRKPDVERNTRLVEALRGPHTIAKIAKDFGISGPRVHAIGHQYCPEVMRARVLRASESVPCGT